MRYLTVLVVLIAAMSAMACGGPSEPNQTPTPAATVTVTASPLATASVFTDEEEYVIDFVRTHVTELRHVLNTQNDAVEHGMLGDLKGSLVKISHQADDYDAFIDEWNRVDYIGGRTAELERLTDQTLTALRIQGRWLISVSSGSGGYSDSAVYRATQAGVRAKKNIQRIEAALATLEGSGSY